MCRCRPPGDFRSTGGLLLCCLLLVACGAQPVATDDTDTAPDPTGAARATVQAMQTAIATVTLPADTAGPVVPLSNIDDFPEQYAGEPVAVRGIVVSLIGDAAFQLTDTPLLSSDTLLVVAADGTADVAEGDILLVRGRVRHLDPENVPEEIDPLKWRLFRGIALECGQGDWQRLPLQCSISRIGTGCGRAEARPYHKMSTLEREIDPGFLNDILPAFDGDTVMIAQSIAQLSSDALDE
jgi:hypothetical protein